MRMLYLRLRSLFLWLLSVPFLTFQVALLLLLDLVLSQRAIYPLLRVFFRIQVFLAGARLEVRHAAGFDRKRTCMIVSNHVNLFDPFFLCWAIPQNARGAELESHFSIPLYGWLMGRFGNVPIPDKRSAEGLKRAYRLTGEALDSGTTVVVFAEGARTLDGRLRRFEPGVFRMASKLGYPIVPISMVHMFDFKHKQSLILHPGKVIIHVHDTIETKGMSRTELQGLSDRVHDIISKPIEAAMVARAALAATASRSG